jgi:tRNA (cmo5U34)-methyltransferase
MGQFHWDPDTYLELMRSEVPDYERLQDAVARACAEPPLPVRAMLELGTGTGETAGRMLRAQPDAELVGIDASRGMLDVAREALPADRATLTLGRLEDSLPPGPFQLVFSALAVHHVDGPGKAALFDRVAAVLPSGGRFVLGDVIVPVDPADIVTPIDDDGYDKPSTVADQLGWLEAAGFQARVAWAHRDLAVLVGDRAE